jgi:diguanylate cyclase (GGDEF)-like protein/PAS domain S-box-containing protein
MIDGDPAVAEQGPPAGASADPRLLIVAPEAETGRRLVALARAAFPDVVEDALVVRHLTEARGVLVLGSVDCVLLATPSSVEERPDDVGRLAAGAPSIPVVLVVERWSPSLLLDALGNGAQDALGLDTLGPELLRHAVLGAIGRTRRPLAEGARDASMATLAREDEIFALLDADGRIMFISDRTRELLGVVDGSLLGESGFAHVHAADLQVAADALFTALATPGVRQQVRLRARPGSGPWRDLEVSITNLLAHPSVGALVLVGEDVTERNRVTIAGHLEAQLLDRLPAAVIVTDDAGVVVYWNRKATAIYGFGAEEALGRDISELGIVTDDVGATPRAEARSPGSWEGEYNARRKDGTTVPVLATLQAVEAPEIGFRGHVGASLDNSERRKLSESLTHQALHDPLTGLPNRALFLDRVEHALARLQRSPGTLAILFLDLDRFKIINDTGGHDAGDEVLRAVAALIEGVLRPEDTVARMGGDEFAVCCEQVTGPDHAVALAERLTAAVSQPFKVANHEFYVSPSIGVVMGHGGSGETAMTLLRDADSAMYHAKDLGRGRIELFDHGMRLDVVRRAEVALALHHAVDREELRLLYQPLVDLEDGRLIGFEALLRWQHPDRGLLGPGEFIDIAEETNAIIAIGAWAIGEAARQLAAWRDELPEHPISMSVNLSAKQVGDKNLANTVRTAIEQNQLQPSALCLEITESVLMEDAEASVATLRELKSIGIELAIDDFGTGYSSLAYLKRFPVDYLKIDRSFVHGVARETEDAVIVKAVIELGKALGLSVVAEGVETDAQLAELRRLGCELAQGYRWSTPRSPADALHLAETWVDEPDTSPGAAAVAASDESAVLSTAEILAVLTHELATPLTVVKGQIERLVGLAGEMPGVAQLVSSVVRNADRIENLVATLADAQQLDTGSLVVRATTFDLVELVRDAASGALPEERAIEIVAEGEVPVEADGRRIEQILVNLLTNAHKFSPPHAPIRVTVEDRGDEVAVVVADEGPGVPPERVGDIFRKFARLERTKKGVGLGLYISRRLARAHGGDVHYFRRDPVGSEFVVVLPRNSINGPGSPAVQPAKR